jgi:hypothetical protein
MSYRYVLQYLLSENHKIAIISTSTDVREKQAHIWSNWNFGRTHSIKSVFFMWIPKWGLPFLYLLYFKSYCKKRDLVIII